LVSVGSDHSMNIWDNQTFDLKNEFFCQAPGTALSLIRNNSDNQLKIAVGDQIGNIYLLKLIGE